MHINFLKQLIKNNSPTFKNIIFVRIKPYATNKNQYFFLFISIKSYLVKTHFLKVKIGLEVFVKHTFKPKKNL